MKMRKIDGRSLGYNRDTEIKHRPNKKRILKNRLVKRDIYICGYIYIYREIEREREKLERRRGGIDRG